MFTGAYAINPVNNEKVPIWIANYVLADYGTGAVMGVPAHDQRDWEFAKEFDLPLRLVVQIKNRTSILRPWKRPTTNRGPGQLRRIQRPD